MTPIHRFVGAGLCLLLAPQLTAASTQVFPATGTGGAYRIAIVSDGLNNETEFNNIVKSVVDGVFADPFYASKKAAFTIVSVFEAQAPGTSRFGFKEGTGETNCEVDWTDDTSGDIEKALIGIGHKRVIVIGGLDFVFGCSDDQWTYLPKRIRGHDDITRHELGHLIAGLYDEYFPEPPAVVPFSGLLLDLNCSINTTTPWWLTSGSFPGATSKPGCKSATSGIVRPYDDCRMRHYPREFCAVCAYLMGNVLDVYINPPLPPTAPTQMKIQSIAYVEQPPPPLNDQSVRLLVNVNTTTKVARVVTAANEAGPYVPSYRRTGNIVYEISENGETIETGVLPGDPFEIRSYKGRGTPHGSETKPSANVLVFIPRATLQTVLGRNFTVSLYQMSPSLRPRDDVTPAAFKTMRQSNAAQLQLLGTVQPGDLKKVVEEAAAGRGRGRV